MVQLHKEFTDNQIKALIERYLKKEIERKYIQEVLGIGKTRFFALTNITNIIQQVKNGSKKAVPNP